MIREAIAKLIDGQDLTREESAGVMEEIMGGEATPAQIAAFLVALRIKGETVEEITGCAQVMRRMATRIRTGHPVGVDTCGTGGDGGGTFNVSTAAAFVVAGAGVCVAKHGNRSVSSRCGSADVLQALGVRIEAPPEKVEQCLDRVGIGFLFAPLLHGAMKHAIGPRREIGVRTIFNLLGPLTNPAGATRQVLGVYDGDLTETLARVLGELGAERALVVHGVDGLDEITTTGPTKVSELRDGEVNTYYIDPTQFGLPLSRREDLLGGTAEQNAQVLLEVLEGKPGPQRDIVLLNAAAGLVVGGRAETLAQGVELAAESIDSGRALEKLEGLRRVSNS